MTDSANQNIGEDAQPSLLIVAEEPEQVSLVVAEAAAPVALVVAEESDETFREVLASVVKAKAKAAPKAAAAKAAPQPAPLPLPQPIAEAIITEEASAPSPRPKRSLRRLIPLAAVSLAVVASSISAIGILVASRVVARTNIVLEQVEAHQSKMRHLDTLIDQIEGLRQREQLALVKIEQINAGRPATAFEVRTAINGLQMALSKYQPGGGGNSMAVTLRDGQSELAERITTIYRRVEQVDAKVSALVKAQALVPIRK